VQSYDGREQRAQQTKRRIRRAAGELIVAKGLEHTTVDEIVAAAGIAKATFYLHFKSKEELVLEYGRQRLRHAAALLPEVLLLGSVEAALRALVGAVLKDKDWHPELVKVAMLRLAESYDRLQALDLRQLLLPLIELGTTRGELRTDIAPATLASFVADTIYSGLRNWGMGLSGDDLNDALDNATELALDAIRRR
jgi:AcrR family transcriptional regulator